MASDETPAPDFIQFLFSNKPKFDCFFEVGNKTQGKPEKIGAVKLMLMAHSEVFRLQLEESDLAEKKDVIPVVDVHPSTFKGMLKYVYGHDTTSELNFDEADNMLYVAEKYMMKMLKNKLAVRLMKLLNPDNLCSLLNNPACYTHLELDSAITEILRYETDRVLASPQFVFINTDGFVKILEQDGLAVPEIELWRAAIKWAKHRANSEDGQVLRHQISDLTKHLRLCTLTNEQFSGEVVTTNVLKRDEIGVICQSIVLKEKPQSLNDFSDTIEPRKMLHSTKNLIVISGYCSETSSKGYYNFKLLTGNNTVELLPLVCSSTDRPLTTPKSWTYKVDCTVTITKVANPRKPDSSSNDPPITATFSDEEVKYGAQFEIPLVVDGKNITLLPDTKYTVKISLVGDHKGYYAKSTVRYSNDHFAFGITYNSASGYHCTPFTKLQYRATTVGNH